ncbi:hypothetical protein NE237_023265 [Protea cynaroides]|uniref:SHSP domain-containing protein n=1 Tax=Protea cynaroides TaxID=273540 RepID=A0A9Q0HDL1_9MAGN|nr:hypothetical protein NE237_023265 [Protea cynaroides]
MLARRAPIMRIRGQARSASSGVRVCGPGEPETRLKIAQIAMVTAELVRIPNPCIKNIAAMNNPRVTLFANSDIMVANLTDSMSATNQAHLYVGNHLTCTEGSVKNLRVCFCEISETRSSESRVGLSSNPSRHSTPEVVFRHSSPQIRKNWVSIQGGEIPVEIWGLYKLEVLDLEGNSSLPASPFPILSVDSSPPWLSSPEFFLAMADTQPSCLQSSFLATPPKNPSFCLLIRRPPTETSTTRIFPFQTENANTDAISTVCQDGVLTITVEKLSPPKPKKPKNTEVKIA